jgi:cell division control protein 7
VEGCDFIKDLPKFTELQVARYMRELFIALAHVHRFKIIHRDVKPYNFMCKSPLSASTACRFLMHGCRRYNFDVDGGIFRLIDFGLAEKEKSKQEFIFFEKEKERARGGEQRQKQVGDGAARGGTKGFRAPEVLMKVVHQTTAIDIWSAGVIFLSMLCNRFPVLSHTDDDLALLEIAAVVGDKKMADVAKSLGRRLELPAKYFCVPICF